MMAHARATIPTQVYLTRAQHRRLRAESARRGLSMTELVRRYIDRGLSDREAAAPAPEAFEFLIGFARDSSSDVAENHDAYLAQRLRQGKRRGA
jgi:hypothetical protein